MIELTDTTAAAIATEFIRQRRLAGSPAMGMVMTLVVVAAEADAQDALDAAQAASREHPARVLGLLVGSGREASRVDAQVDVGSGGWSGEAALIRLSGAVTKHADSVILPLLLPDSPVVVWWASTAPADPAEDRIGRLASRRITDAAAVHRGKTNAMLNQCRVYAPGNTDLAWTRITQWRAHLAAALDQHHVTVTGATVSAERISPSADLLGAWLSDRLGIDVARQNSPGPGITEVTLHTSEGDITIARGDGKLGILSAVGQPDRKVALRRRALPELLAEEMRHLDEDDIFAATARRFVTLHEESA